MSLDVTPLSPFAYRLAAHSALGQPELAALLSLNGPVVRIVSNRDFVRAGEMVGNAAFIVSGLVGSFGQKRDGARQITALHLPGDMANLHSVAVPEASEALQALSETTIISVPHSELRDLAERYPKLATAFWRESVLRWATTAQWAVNLGRSNAIGSVAHLICEVACRSSGTTGEDGLSFEFPATQAQIADMLGLTSIHVNRMLSSLRAQGMIARSRNVVTIRDWDRLARIGEFDGEYLHLRPRTDYVGPDPGQRRDGLADGRAGHLSTGGGVAGYGSGGDRAGQ